MQARQSPTPTASPSPLLRPGPQALRPVVWYEPDASVDQPRAERNTGMDTLEMVTPDIVIGHAEEEPSRERNHM